MSLLLKIRAWFTPSVIDVVLPDPAREAFPMGIQLVAIDVAKTRWTIVEGARGARINHYGAWYVDGTALDESFVFSLKNAKSTAIALLSRS